MKRGQVWMETVTYTLVAFVLIGLILAFVKPEIDELQDKALIEQSMNVLRQIDSGINDAYNSGTGNKRLLEVSIKEGKIVFDSINDTIYFLIDSNYMYSEPGQVLKDGAFDVLTARQGSGYEVYAGLNYTKFNLTYSGEEKTKILPSSASFYELFVYNKGGENIDFLIK